jgi:hypothetical protein
VTPLDSRRRDANFSKPKGRANVQISCHIQTADSKAVISDLCQFLSSIRDMDDNFNTPSMKGRTSAYDAVVLHVSPLHVFIYLADIHETWYECNATGTNHNVARFKFLQSGLASWLLPAAVRILQGHVLSYIY